MSAPVNPCGVDRMPSRRAVFGLAAGAALVALPITASAEPSWSATEWVGRWNRLGCGVRQDRQGLLQLTPLRGTEAASGTMLAELAPAGRLQAVTEALNRSGHYDTCPALIAAEALSAHDAAYGGDEDEATETAWLEQDRILLHRLRYSPARSRRGLAAKLRHGIEAIDTPDGDAIIADVLRQIEIWE